MTQTIVRGSLNCNQVSGESTSSFHHINYVKVYKYKTKLEDIIVIQKFFVTTKVAVYMLQSQGEHLIFHARGHTHTDDGG